MHPNPRLGKLSGKQGHVSRPLPPVENLSPRPLIAVTALPVMLPLQPGFISVSLAP